MKRIILIWKSPEMVTDEWNWQLSKVPLGKGVEFGTVVRWGFEQTARLATEKAFQALAEAEQS